MRIGQGYDVHRLVEGRKLILGGVDIPYDRGLLGHSGRRRRCTPSWMRLLGAAAMGDIGKLFPDTDPHYEGADSLALLSEVCIRLRSAGFEPGQHRRHRDSPGAEARAAHRGHAP